MHGESKSVEITGAASYSEGQSSGRHLPKPAHLQFSSTIEDPSVLQLQ